MFTGIITSIGTIEAAEQRGDLRIVIATDYAADSFNTGESIAVNGACLTVVASSKMASGKGRFTADLSAETVSRTAPGQWNIGRRANLERSLKLGDTLDGHMVSGHVDGIATLAEITPSGDSNILAIDVPNEFARFIAEKGSITLDGISLTVNKVEKNRFWVNIIPHTWQKTSLSDRKAGDKLNFEIDLIARYVERLLAK